MDVGHAYEWLVVVGAFAAFIFGFATGANDVANAFGTSVGAKTLKLWHAVVIAAIFEFAGALALGRVNTEVIATNIASPNAFARAPEILAYGMVCALFVGGFWQLLASYLELNVSATHSIVGGIMGFALVHAGKKGVVWADRDPGAFPPYKGVVAIILSWFISPVLSALAAAIIFLIVRHLILRRPNGYNYSFFALPLLLFVTVFINVYFAIIKGAGKYIQEHNHGKKIEPSTAAWISAIVAAGCFLLGIPTSFLIRRKVDATYDVDGNKIVQPSDPETGIHQENGTQGTDNAKSANPIQSGAAHPAPSMVGKVKKAVLRGVTYDIHEAVEKDDELTNLHARAEIFQPRLESFFSFLQVVSACAVILAHGAGEVGYMAGPLTTIYHNYTKGELHSKGFEPPIWVVIVGALGLVIGLATYGYKVTQAMGVKLAKLSPSRGFAAELATALIITLAAQYKLPTSSSQCITGAIVGVGLAEGVRGVAWKQFLRQFVFWVLTLVVVGLTTAAVFSQGVYAPSEIDGRNVQAYEDRLVNVSKSIYTDLNATLSPLKQPASDGLLPRLTLEDWKSINSTLSHSYSFVKNLTNTNVTQTVEVKTMFDAFNTALQTLQKHTIKTLGQPEIYAGAQRCYANSTLGIQGLCTAPSVV